MGKTFFMDWEVDLIVWMQNHLGGAGAKIASIVSMFGEEIACVLILGFLYWCYNKEIGKKVGITLLTANVFNTMIKNVFVRKRPYMDHSDIECLKPVAKNADINDIAAQGYSFPSGHSTNIASTFSSLIYYIRKKSIIIIGIIIPLLVGISRFCLGVHYPTDVIAGWALGVASMFLIVFLSSKIKNKYIMYLIIIIVSLVGLFYCESDDYFTAIGMLIGFVLAVIFEEKYVNFENTKNPLRCVLRIVLGGAIFFGLNTLFKMPFSKEMLESGSLAAHIIRCARYMIVIFIDIGVYPMIFKFGNKLFDRKK